MYHFAPDRCRCATRLGSLDRSHTASASHRIPPWKPGHVRWASSRKPGQKVSVPVGLPLGSVAHGFSGSVQHVPDPAAHSTGRPFHTVQPPHTQSRPGWQQLRPHSSDGGGGGQQPRLLKQNTWSPPLDCSRFGAHFPLQHSSPSSQHSLSSLGSSSGVIGGMSSGAHSLSGLRQHPFSTSRQRVKGSSFVGMQPVPQQDVPVRQQSFWHLPSACTRALNVQGGRGGGGERRLSLGW